jgi:hypothetical protein
MDQETKEAEERLKEVLVECRGLIHLNTNAVYDELFEVLGNNRETMFSLRLNSAVKDPYMLHRLWHVLSDDSDALCMGNLRHLTLTGVKIHGDGGDPGLHLAFVKLCQRLETLECKECPMKLWLMPPSFMEGRTDDTQPTLSLKQVKLVDVVDSILIHAYFLKRCKMKCISEKLKEGTIQWNLFDLQAPS